MIQEIDGKQLFTQIRDGTYLQNYSAARYLS